MEINYLCVCMYMSMWTCTYKEDEGMLGVIRM